MKKHRTRQMKARINITRIIFGLLAAGAVVLAFLFYQSVIWMVLGAIVFSYLLKPVVDFMEKYHITRWLAILIVYLLIAGLLALGGILVVPVLSSQLQDMGSKITDIASKSGSIEEFRITDVELVRSLFTPLIEFTEKTNLFDLDKLFQGLLYYLQRIVTDIPHKISLYAGKMFNLFTFLFMVPTLGFFFLKDREQFRQYLFKLIPNQYFELTVIIAERSDSVLKTFFRAMMLEMLIVAAMSSIAMIIVGVPYSIVVGLIAGIGNVIPYLGPAVGIVAATISILLSGSPLVLIVSAIIALQIVQFLENRFIYPFVMAKSMEMHPMIILLTVLAGGYTMGFIGMLFAVPLVFLVKEIAIILIGNLRKFEIL